MMRTARSGSPTTATCRPEGPTNGIATMIASQQSKAIEPWSRPRVTRLIVIDVLDLAAGGARRAQQRQQPGDLHRQAQAAPACTVLERDLEERACSGRRPGGGGDQEGDEDVVIAGDLDELDRRRRKAVQQVADLPVARRLDRDQAVGKARDRVEARIDGGDRARLGAGDEAEAELVAAQGGARGPADQARITGLHPIFEAEREAPLPVAKLGAGAGSAPQPGQGPAEREPVPGRLVHEGAISLPDRCIVAIVLALVAADPFEQAADAVLVKALHQ